MVDRNEFRGHIDGVDYEIVDGLISFRMQKHQADDVVTHLQSWIKVGAREENPAPGSLLNTMRAAYLAYQLQTDCRLSDLDAHDIDILYTMVISPKNEWFFRVSNEYRPSLRRLENRISMGMIAAKSVYDVLSQ